MYTLIHPTKTGGIAFGTHLQRYPDIKTKFLGHRDKCTEKTKNIITIREPFDRFKSMYLFWKYGSEYQGCERPIGFQSGTTIKNYIQYIQNNSKELIKKFSGVHHYAPQTLWLPEEAYTNTIVVVYTSDLTQKVCTLLRFLEIPWDHGRILPINVSLKKETIEFDSEDLDWIRDYYRTDFELWKLIHENPEKFFKVL